MTGTPMVNDPFELVPCVNMLHGKELIINDYNTFIASYFTSNNLLRRDMDTRNLWDLQNRCMGVISFS